ncbi:MAG: glycosyltransferase family 4 protein [Brevinematales bacterium]|nr:glycosyltransferase family 4 protein [Brevinematales bacterium]
MWSERKHITKKLHFVFSSTEKARGGGTTLWRFLLSSPGREVWLHYSSYAKSLWEDVSHPFLHHVVHQGWGTYERAPTPFPWKNTKGFHFSLIERGDVVVFDSREALQQLALPLSRKGARLFWHMQSRERVLRKKLWIVPWDIRCYRRLSGIVAISEFVKRTFEKDLLYPCLGQRIPCEVIPNGISSTFERIEPTHEYIVYFGRYEGYKHPLFLEKLGYEVRYIGGTGGCAVPVEVPKEKDLGWMSPQEAAKWGDIFVFPAIEEAFGLALVEMMSYGKIVIAFRSGAFPEIIDDGVDGFLVEPFDVKKTRKIIERIRFSSELKQRISSAAREKAKRYRGEEYRKRFWESVDRMVNGEFGKKG